MKLTDKADKAADLRKYDKFVEGPQVRVYNHKKSQQDIWLDGSQEEGMVYVYGDIPRKLQNQREEWKWKMEFNSIEKATHTAKILTDMWDYQYEPPEKGLTKQEEQNIENDILDVIEKEDTGEGVSYEVLRDEVDHKEEEIKDGVNSLLSEGTIYENRPVKVQKL